MFRTGIGRWTGLEPVFALRRATRPTRLEGFEPTPAWGPTNLVPALELHQAARRPAHSQPLRGLTGMPDGDASLARTGQPIPSEPPGLRIRLLPIKGLSAQVPLNPAHAGGSNPGACQSRRPRRVKVCGCSLPASICSPVERINRRCGGSSSIDSLGSRSCSHTTPFAAGICRSDFQPQALEQPTTDAYELRSM